MARKNSQGPRRKRMQRKSRLQAAEYWVLTYSGKNIIRGYRKWFGVDLLCAIRELKLLGIKLDEDYVSKALKSQEQMIVKKQEKKKRALELENFLLDSDSDENFSFIVGYTAWGFPYGTTWEEGVEGELEDSF